MKNNCFNKTGLIIKQTKQINYKLQVRNIRTFQYCNINLAHKGLYMTSVYSHPNNAFSFTQSEPMDNQTFKPKFIHLLDENKLNATVDYQPKKLPFNLFLSATEYNKMLITNGKSRNKNAPKIIDGLITSLQYMNDPIFERQIDQISKAKYKKKVQLKPQQNQHIKNSKNLHPHKFCGQDPKNSKNYCKLSHSEVNKDRSLDYQTLISAKNNRYSINYKPTHKKSKFIAQSRRAQSSFEKSRKNNKNNLNDESIIRKSHTKRNPDISHLIIKSLIEYTEKKKAQKLYKASMEKTRYAKDQYLKMLNEKIRSYNLEGSRRLGVSRSRSKQRSLTKNQISLSYWDKIKNQVLRSLKNDNYSHPLKAELQNYHFNVYDHKQITPRKPKLSSQQVEYLRKIRELQAKRNIERKSKQKQYAQRRVKQNLLSLQKQRKKRISYNPKKPFNPTANLIRSAFQNLTQTRQKQGQAQVRHASSIFMNEGIRKIKTNRKQDIKK